MREAYLVNGSDTMLDALVVCGDVEDDMLETLYGVAKFVFSSPSAVLRRKNLRNQYLHY